MNNNSEIDIQLESSGNDLLQHPPQDSCSSQLYWISILRSPLFKKALHFFGFDSYASGIGILVVLFLWTTWQLVLNVIVRFQNERTFGSLVWVLLPGYGFLSYWRLFALCIRSRRMAATLKIDDLPDLTQKKIKKHVRFACGLAAIVGGGTLIKSMIAAGLSIINGVIPYTTIAKIPAVGEVLFVIHIIVEPVILLIISVALLFPFIFCFHVKKKTKLYLVQSKIPILLVFN